MYFKINQSQFQALSFRVYIDGLVSKQTTPVYLTNSQDYMLLAIEMEISKQNFQLNELFDLTFRLKSKSINNIGSLFVIFFLDKIYEGETSPPLSTQPIISIDYENNQPFCQSGQFFTVQLSQQGVANIRNLQIVNGADGAYFINYASFALVNVQNINDYCSNFYGIETVSSFYYTFLFKNGEQSLAAQYAVDQIDKFKFNNKSQLYQLYDRMIFEYYSQLMSTSDESDEINLNIEEFSQTSLLINYFLSNQFIFGRPIQIDLQKQLCYIYVGLMDEQEFLDNGNLLYFQQEYQFYVIFFDQNYSILNADLFDIEVQMVNVPSYDILYHIPTNSQNKYDRYMELNKIEQNYSSFQRYKFRMKQGFFGTFGFTAMSQGVVSNILVANTIFPPDHIEILQQPDSNFNDSFNTTKGTFITGNFLPQFSVKLFDKDNNTLYNYPIIIAVDTNSSDSQYFQATGNLGEIYGFQSSEMNPYNIQYTDQEGVAKFVNATLIDSKGDFTCIRFVFICGDDSSQINMRIESQPTNLYCFQNVFKIRIMNPLSYSTTISPQSNFNTPIVIRLFAKEFPNIVQTDFSTFLMSATIYELNRQKVLDNSNKQIYLKNIAKATSYYLKNSVCGFIAGVNLKQGCIIRSFNPENLYIDIELASLQWEPQMNGNFRVSLSTILNFAVKQDEISLSTFEQILTIQNMGQMVQLINDYAIRNPEDYLLQKFSLDVQQGVVLANNIQQQLIIITGNQNASIDDLWDIVSTLDPAQMINLMPNLTAFFKLQKSMLDIIQNEMITSSTSVETNIITVNYIPDTVLVLKQPQREIYVGNIFTVRIKAITQNYAIQNIPVTVGIVEASNGALQNLKTQAYTLFFQYLGSGTDGLSIQSLFNYMKSNVELSTNNSVQLTNTYGYAQYDLKISSGYPGTFKLQFSYGGNILGESEIFSLKNRIVSVKFHNDVKQKIIVKNKKAVKLSIQPEIEIAYETNLQNYQYQKDIQVKIYTYADLEQVQDNFINSLEDSEKTFIEVYPDLAKISNPNQMIMNLTENNYQSDVFNILRSIRRIIMNGVKFYQATTRADLDLEYNFTLKYITESILKLENVTIANKLIGPQMTTLLTFKDLEVRIFFNFKYFIKIEFPYSFSDYQITVIIDGFETPISNKISAVLPEKDTTEKAVYGLLIIFSLIMILSYSIVNIPTKKYQLLMMIIALLSLTLTIIQIVLIGLEIGYDWKFFDKVSILIVLSCGCLPVIIYVIWSIIYQGHYSKKVSEIRQQSINSVRDTKIELIDNRTEYSLYLHCQYDRSQYYFFKLQLYYEYIYQQFRNKPTKRHIEYMKNQKKYFRMTDQQIQDEFQKDKEFNSKNDYDNWPWYKKFQLLNQTKITLNLEKMSLLFFPSRLWAAIITSFFAILYIALRLIFYFQELSSLMYNQIIFVNDNYTSFIALATNNLSSLPGFSGIINEFLYQQMLAPLDFISNILTQIRVGLYIGCYISVILGFIIFTLDLLMVLINYKMRMYRIFLGRKEKDFIIKNTNAGNSAYFVGGFISQAVISYFTTAIALSFVFCPMFMPFFYQILWEFRVTILLIIASPVISILHKTLWKMCSCDAKWVKNTRLYAIFCVLQMYLSIAAGISSGLTRFIMAIGVFLANSFVVAFSIYQQSFQFLDTLFFSYLAIIKLQRISEGIILVWSKEVDSIKFLQKRRQQIKLTNYSFSEPKKLMIRNRLWLWYFLEKNKKNSISKYRIFIKNTDTEKDKDKMEQSVDNSSQSNTNEQLL